MNSVRNILIINVFLILIGLTPLYPWFSNSLQKLSRPGLIFLTGVNQRLLQFSRFVSSLPSLSSENKNLRSQILVGRVFEAQLKDSQKENELLRSQLKMPVTKPKQELFLSRVLGKQEKGDLLILQGGLDQGLRPENLVAIGGVLLGKVVEVGPSQSKMRLTVSAESRFEVRSSDSLVRGEVSGSFGNQSHLSKVLPSQTLSVGQELLEMGSGLLIGKILAVEKAGAKIFKEAQVSVPYDPNLLGEVFVYYDSD